MHGIVDGWILRLLILGNCVIDGVVCVALLITLTGARTLAASHCVLKATRLVFEGCTADLIDFYNNVVI